MLETLFTKILINKAFNSPADRLAMGIHETYTNRTSIPEPTTLPIMKFVADGEDLQLLVTLPNAAINKLAKPAGVCFLEIWYSMDTPIAVVVADTTLKINSHESGTMIAFLGEKQGKKMYYFASWATHKGFCGS